MSSQGQGVSILVLTSSHSGPQSGPMRCFPQGLTTLSINPDTTETIGWERAHTRPEVPAEVQG